jgi:type I restriction enzyme S subunit
MTYNAPRGWKTTPLGQLLDVQNGFAFASEKFSKNTGMPLIRIRDLKKGLQADSIWRFP